MPAPDPIAPHMREETDILIENATVALPDGMKTGLSVRIENGRFARVTAAATPNVSSRTRRIDATGLILAPGFIDLHSDAIEKEIRPRPGGNFPLDVALTELDKKLAACGITTMYHCLCFGESETNELRTARKASEVARHMRSMTPRLTVNNRIHVRFEVSDIDSVPTLRELITQRGMDLFSIMDHTPGQGQFVDLNHFKSYYSQAEHLTGDQAEALAHERMSTRAALGEAHIRELTALCATHGIPMASHDDDTVEKVDWIKSMGIAISEFPVRLAAARRAVQHGMQVLMGAPNILRGGSLTGNLSGQDAIREGVCTLIGSDYAPMSILHAVFQLHQMGIVSLHESIKMASTYPARAVGLDHERGRIEEGLAADCILIDTHTDVPRIVNTFVNGHEVFSAPARLGHLKHHTHATENNTHEPHAYQHAAAR